MRLPVSILLFALGAMLLATPWLPIGLGLIWLSWWIYERTGGDGNDEAFTAILMLLGAAGAALVFPTSAWDAVKTLL